MAWFAAEYGNRNVAILNESATVHAAGVETLGTASRLVHSFRIRAVASAFPEQTKGLAHLQLGLGGLTRVVGVGGRPLQRTRCNLLIL